ncbi:ATP-binding protein, partial [Candidatus Woesearchaeota archaeon]|nr:ATP-binding protein [Candidatus Woesearchaeota archaeon]
FMERKELYFVLFEQQKDFEQTKDLVDREKSEDIIKLKTLKMPVIITGVRRCGKSSIFKIIKDRMGLSEKEYLYVDFNDERLIDFSIGNFQMIIDFLDENNYIKNCVLFIDEIQEADGWEKWIDRIRQKYIIFISGSNSKLLSKEISTILTGRSLNFGLFPFSFKEFLNSKGIDINQWKLNLKTQSEIRKNFDIFIESGGLPQRVISDQDIIVSELYENILYRDIISRFNKNLVKPIKEISLYLISNVNSDTSLRNLSYLSGIKNLSTIKRILDAFENAFLFFSISKFDYSIKKQLQNPKKIYCIDNGFITSLGFRFTQNKGNLLENLVAIELKRRGNDIYFYKDKLECDFLIKEKLKIVGAIQVCFDLDEKNEKREFNSLMEAIKKFNLKKGLVLTYGQEKEIEIEKKKIIIKPVWKWLLEK